LDLLVLIAQITAANAVDIGQFWSNKPQSNAPQKTKKLIAPNEKAILFI